ncbi:MAG: two-component regulator propeller domain-containing protein [Bacteroidota bacterium]
MAKFDTMHLLPFIHLLNKCSLFLLAVWLINCSLQAQVSFLQTQFYSLNDGLSNRNITDIYQNKNGYLWIATPNGLNRFDGYQFKVLNNSWDNPYKISGNGPEQIAEDKHGHLVLTYATNYGFFDLLDPYSLSTQKVELLPEYGIRGIVRQIIVSREGEIYILSISRNQQDSLHLYQYNHGNDETPFASIFSREEQERYSSAAKLKLLSLQNGTFLLSDSEKGIRLFDQTGQVIQAISSDDFPGSQTENFHQLLHEDINGQLWISFENEPGLYTLEQSSIPDNTFQLFNKIPSDQHYSDIWEDQKGNLLVIQKTPITQTNNALYCITPTQRVQDFSFLLEVGNYIVHVASADFFKTLYVGIDTGLKIVQNNLYKVKTYLAESLDVDQRGKIIRGITDNGKDKLYFAREVSRWYAIDLEYDLIDTIELRDPETDEVLNFNCGFDLEFGQGGHLWGILCDGSSSGLLVQYDTANCTTEFFDYSERFYAMDIDQEGTIWLSAPNNGDKGSLIAFNASSNQFELFYDQEGNNPFQDALPRFIAASESGLLWVGSDHGLFKVDPSERTAERYLVDDTEGSMGLPSNVIYEIYEDDQDRLWLGTTNGLSIFDLQKNTFTNYDTRHGLASNTVCGIVPNGDGNYWVSTFDGLSYFDTEKKLFRNFYREDGFSHDEFNRFSYHKDPNGRIYLGGVNGLNVFDAADLLVDESVPPVILTEVKKYDVRNDSNIVLETNLNELESIYISPYHNFFQVHFTIPDFANPQRNQYQARLEGYEKSWAYLGNANYVRYSKLPPDNYVLHIRGADANGNWSNEVLSIPIEVGAHFTEQWWFFVLMILFIAAVIYGLFQYQLEQRLKVERIRMKLSSDLHDEVTGLLSGIAMQTDVLQLQLKDEQIQQRVKTIGEVSRKAISKMSDVIWSIDSRKDKVGDLLDRMHEHADDVLVPIRINYTFKIQRIDRNQKMPVNIRQNLYFIFKEAINNIAKHSSASVVEVQFGNNGNHFELIVEDNGDSSKAAPAPKTSPSKFKRKGQGLSNLKMRAERINAQLDIFQNPGYSIQLKMRRFV